MKTENAENSAAFMIEEYEKLRLEAMGGARIFPEPDTDTLLGKLLSFGMAGWMKRKNSGEPCVAIFPDKNLMDRSVKTYPVELIGILTDMALSNIQTRGDVCIMK